MKKLFELFWTFAKMGAVCFGGGYAMLPLLERELVTKRGWTTQEELLDYYAIGQCTPGVIAVNVSTFIGYKRCGIVGAVAATTGMVFFPVIIIMIIAGLLRNFAENVYVQRALSGIAVCVCVLIADAVSKLWSKSIKNKFGIIVFAVVLLLSLFTDISSGFFVLGAGLLGILFFGREGSEK
ncbi:MAG: chromate transporter [Firmicutes bacterium]|nr:chromate transporter [Bacillota bacterium]